MAQPRPRPKHEEIAADLELRIRSGEYEAGSPLPAQRALSAAYGVTLMTLRQALQTLARDGLIVLRAGKDTLVQPPHARYRLDSLRSLTEDLRDQGIEVSTQVLGATMRPPPAWVSARLGPDRALRLERLRVVQGRPAVHQVSWVREPYGAAIRGRDFRFEQLYAALTEVGAVVHRASETIRPNVLGARVAGLLRQPVGAPVFVSERVTYGQDGDAVVVDRASILGSAMEIRADRSPARIQLRWGQHTGDLAASTN